MYALMDQLVGAPALGLIGAVNANPALTPPGNFVTASDPWWGSGEFIYGVAQGTIPEQSLCIITPTFQTNAYRFDAIVCPNTANLGKLVAVSMQSMVAGDKGWFCISGIVPVACNASVAADTAWGIAAAGQGGAVAAGKQVLNSRILVAATATVAKANVQAPNGSLILQVPSSDGWFQGVFLSGTGIAASTKVTAISPDGRSVTINNATTAVVNGTVTATYNNATIFYNVAHLNRSFAQGQIT